MLTVPNASTSVLADPAEYCEGRHRHTFVIENIPTCCVACCVALSVIVGSHSATNSEPISYSPGAGEHMAFILDLVPRGMMADAQNISPQIPTPRNR